MKTGKAGILLIQSSESCADKREDGRIYPYIDDVGVATIGWGSTYYASGKRVLIQDGPITQAEADNLFSETLKKYEDGVNFLVKSKINQNQFDACVSFSYNVGLDLNHNGIAEGFGESTLLRKINANPADPSIRAEFMKWDKGIVNHQLVTLPGLTKRREDEANLYFS